LNLQRLRAQVNIDMPWNPSRLVQRKGRVQRIGQVRDDVHVLNLRYAGTVEDQVYAALSSRFGDIFSVLGQLPDSFEDDWVAAILSDRTALQNFSQRVDKTRPAGKLGPLIVALGASAVAATQGRALRITPSIVSGTSIRPPLLKLTECQRPSA
jgi:hypothetical protein